MNQIQNPEEIELVIKKSRFIAFSFVIEDKEAAKAIIGDLKAKYKDARHVVWAYRLGNDGGFDDDGEPSKTAGYAMLEVLNLKNITNTLVVCVRYFGGIKLGSGGLIRAYAKACSEVLNKSQIVMTTPATVLEVAISLDKITKVNAILAKQPVEILTREITDKMILTLKVPEHQEAELRAILTDFDYQISITPISKSVIII